MATPADVQDIICGPVGWADQEALVKDALKRAKEAFYIMVDSILQENEDERATEIVARTQRWLEN